MTSDVTSIVEIKENHDAPDSFLEREERIKVLQELNEQYRKELQSLKEEEERLKQARREARAKRKVDSSFPKIALRKSLRLERSPSVSESEDCTPPSVSNKPSNKIERPPNDYGPMPGVHVGFHWETRLECSRYGVHRPTVAGIHGGPHGAYSIALSGGYPEDVDEGDSFIYTGAGGRDLKGTASNPKNLRTAPQTRNQELEGTNLSLVKSIESELPVRVIRGYKSQSIYAPETGYRYDGLYQVVDYWEDIGTTGFRVYRFKMVRMKNQGPAPWEKDFEAYNKERLKENGGEDVDSDYKENTSEDLDSDYKENIPPSDSNFIENNDEAELNSVNNEIETCVNLLFKISPIANKDSLIENCSIEEFLGWD